MLSAANIPSLPPLMAHKLLVWVTQFVDTDTLARVRSGRGKSIASPVMVSIMGQINAEMRENGLIFVG